MDKLEKEKKSKTGMIKLICEDIFNDNYITNNEKLNNLANEIVEEIKICEMNHIAIAKLLTKIPYGFAIYIISKMEHKDFIDYKCLIDGMIFKEFEQDFKNKTFSKRIKDLRNNENHKLFVNNRMITIYELETIFELLCEDCKLEKKGLWHYKNYKGSNSKINLLLSTRKTLSCQLCVDNQHLIINNYAEVMLTNVLNKLIVWNNVNNF